jgi:hypothetical protein
VGCRSFRKYPEKSRIGVSMITEIFFLTKIIHHIGIQSLRDKKSLHENPAGYRTFFTSWAARCPRDLHGTSTGLPQAPRSPRSPRSHGTRCPRNSAGPAAAAAEARLPLPRRRRKPGSLCRGGGGSQAPSAAAAASSAVDGPLTTFYGDQRLIDHIARPRVDSLSPDTPPAFFRIFSTCGNLFSVGRRSHRPEKPLSRILRGVSGAFIKVWYGECHLQGFVQSSGNRGNSLQHPSSTFRVDHLNDGRTRAPLHAPTQPFIVEVKPEVIGGPEAIGG